ncbi:MAG: replication-associated recombination protein A [Peptostreptococcaceae bacterium]|nr:replication-associated recombination protein A [Peptostreptococcaceae bacterium]
MEPLAVRIRPEKLEDVIGQKHIIGNGKLINSLLEKKQLMNMIFYGPPGTGKTTVANLLARSTDRKFYKINATNAGVGDLKKVIGDLDTLFTMNGVVLYVDEIQHFNRKQQQVLLEHTENGKIVLIASTTENPFQYVYKALLSRSMLFEFRSISPNDMVEGIKNLKERIEIESGKEIVFQENPLLRMAQHANGDYRKFLNYIEIGLLVENGQKVLFDENMAEKILQKKVFSYDRTGDEYYDIISAFQKSIRGSDPDASVHYLARLIEAEDIKPICRRLLVIAAEDIGLAYPNAINIVKACVDSALFVGLPEARIILSEATLLLALMPKSNSAMVAIENALADIATGEIDQIPNNIRDSHFSGAKQLNRGKGYKYPHSYDNHYVDQQYLPDNLKNKNYYESSRSGQETKFYEFNKKIRK